LKELLGKEAKTIGLFGLGGDRKWDGGTETDLQEAIGLMAENFVLSSLVQGKSFIYRDAEEGEGAKTVRDVLNESFATVFEGYWADWVNTRPARQAQEAAQEETRDAEAA
jgi:hypothetical protein